MNKKFFSMIGLAQKAGRVTSGEDACIMEIKSGRSKLVIVAMDSSDNTKKNFQRLCNFRNIPLIEYGTKEVLGKCIGKEYRAVLSIADHKFAKAIMNLYNQGNRNQQGSS